MRSFLFNRLVNDQSLSSQGVQEGGGGRGSSLIDLPTPKPCKSGMFEKTPPKTWRLGP